jgi:hypothetical protein
MIDVSPGLLLIDAIQESYGFFYAFLGTARVNCCLLDGGNERQHIERQLARNSGRPVAKVPNTLQIRSFDVVLQGQK